MKVFFHREIVYFTFIFIFIFFLFSGILDNYIMVSDGIWLKDGINFSFSEFFEPNSHGWLRPLVLLYFSVMYKIFGINFSFYYLANVLFHFTNSLLVYLITKNLLRDFQNKEKIAFLCSLMFACLFSHYEAVIVMCNICDILVATFCFSSFYLLLKYLSASNKIFYIFSIIFFCCALLSKENAVSCPFVFLMFFWIFLKMNFKKNIKILFLYFFILSLYITYYALYIFPLQNIPATRTKIRNPLEIVMINIDCLFELFLSSFSIIKYVYYHAYSLSFPYLSFLIEITKVIMFVCLAIILVGILYKKNKPFKLPFKFIVFSLLWMVFTFFPSTFSQEVILKNFILFPRVKYFYLPSFGLCLFLSILIFYSYQNLSNIFKKIIYVFAISFIVSNSLTTYIAMQGYKQLTYNYKNIITAAGNALQENFFSPTLYLVNFPDGYKNFYGEGIKQAIDVIYKKDVKIIWIKNSDIKNLKNKSDFLKSFFIEFKNKALHNKTEYYRSIIGAHSNETNMPTLSAHRTMKTNPLLSELRIKGVLPFCLLYQRGGYIPGGERGSPPFVQSRPGGERGTPLLSCPDLKRDFREKK